MAHADIRSKRPISPHLTVWRPTITYVMSFMHRATGSALYFGMLLFAWWIMAAAAGPAYFDWVNAIYGSWFGQLVLFGFTWALLHHMLGGLRHFVWDTGRGMDKASTTTMAWATLAGSIVLTFLVWIVGYAVR